MRNTKSETDDLVLGFLLTDIIKKVSGLDLISSDYISCEDQKKLKSFMNASIGVATACWTLGAGSVVAAIIRIPGTSSYAPFLFGSLAAILLLTAITATVLAAITKKYLPKRNTDSRFRQAYNTGKTLGAAVVGALTGSLTGSADTKLQAADTKLRAATAREQAAGAKLQAATAKAQAAKAEAQAAEDRLRAAEDRLRAAAETQAPEADTQATTGKQEASRELEGMQNRLQTVRRVAEAPVSIFSNVASFVTNAASDYVNYLSEKHSP